MPVNTRLEDATLLVVGLACFVYGFFGRDLRGEVEMPMTDEERADSRPTKLWARVLYILFASCMVLWAFYDLQR